MHDLKRVSVLLLSALYFWLQIMQKISKHLRAWWDLIGWILLQETEDCGENVHMNPKLRTGDTVPEYLMTITLP